MYYLEPIYLECPGVTPPPPLSLSLPPSLFLSPCRQAESRLCEGCFLLLDDDTDADGDDDVAAAVAAQPCFRK